MPTSNVAIPLMKVICNIACVWYTSLSGQPPYNQPSNYAQQGYPNQQSSYPQQNPRQGPYVGPQQTMPPPNQYPTGGPPPQQGGFGNYPPAQNQGGPRYGYNQQPGGQPQQPPVGPQGGQQTNYGSYNQPGYNPSGYNQWRSNKNYYTCLISRTTGTSLTASKGKSFKVHAPIMCRSPYSFFECVRKHTC